MARPDTHPGVEGGGGDGQGDGGAVAGPPTVTPATDVVRPGTGVVRPGTGVVRPAAGGGTATDATAAKARAVVPDAPEKPLEPIHVVLPVIPVMPAKQGFLDRLVAPKPKKTEAEIAEEEAQKAAEEARKAEEEQRKADADARRVEAKAAAKAEEDRAKAVADARKAEAKAAEDARKAEEKADTKAADEARKADERARRADEKARRAEAKAREKAARDEDDDEDEYDEDEDYDEPAPRGFAGPTAPPARPPVRPGPPPAPARPAPVGAPPRPAPPGHPAAPPRPAPAPARPQRQPEARPDPRRAPRPVGTDRRGRPWGRLIAAAAAVVALGTGTAVVVGQTAPPGTAGWVAAADTGRAAPVLAGLDTNAKQPSAAGLAAAIGPMLGDSGLGGRVTVSIVDVATGASLYDQNGSSPATPASTAKLLTAAAVLHARGPSYQIPTRAVAGSSPGEVVLIGGGDPTLGASATTTYPGAARLDLLAEQVRKALGGTAPTRLVVDNSLYVGSTQGPGWFDSDLHAGYIAHVTALMTDGARMDPAQTAQNAARYWEPDVAAGQLFAQALGLPADAVAAGSAPANAKPLGQVLSPPIGRLVEMMLAESDNMIAEGLARQVAVARKLPASFEGAAEATAATLAEIGIKSDGVGLADGSGLSNFNKVSAAQLTAVLAQAASPKFPELRSIISGLPVAGYSGTLSGRYQNANNGGSGAGIVRAKTGTLTGVNALAGIAVDLDGRLLAFSMVADATSNSTRALQALDRVAAAVASCGC